jgi:hypothetical protein
LQFVQDWVSLLAPAVAEPLLCNRKKGITAVVDAELFVSGPHYHELQERQNLHCSLYFV